MSGIWFTSAIQRLTEEFERLQNELAEAESIIFAQEQEIAHLKLLLDDKKLYKDYQKVTLAEILQLLEKR